MVKQRITRDALFMGITKLIAKRGTCGRAQVGAVITIDNRIIAMGYNGPLPGRPHCSPSVCDTNTTCERAVHAEMNAISHAAKLGLALDGGVLYCSYSPCETCARMIIQTGISRVVYEKEYKSDRGLLELHKSGIQCTQHTES